MFRQLALLVLYFLYTNGTSPEWRINTMGLFEENPRRYTEGSSEWKKLAATLKSKSILPEDFIITSAEAVDLKYKDLFFDSYKNKHIYSTLPSSMGQKYHYSVKVTKVHTSTVHNISIQLTGKDKHHVTRHTFDTLHTEMLHVDTQLENSVVNMKGVYNNNQIRVLSYNIWNLNPPWQDRLHIIANQIIEMNPSIIALQEVRFLYEYLSSYPIPYQMEDLVHKVNGNNHDYQYVYQPSMTYLLSKMNPYAGRTDEGLGIMAKYPIIHMDYLKLTRDYMDAEDEHQRMILRALVKTPIGLVNILTTHFSLSSTARRRNTLEVWNYVSSLKDPIILLGDFNCEPDSETYKFFTGQMELEGLRGDFKDAWRELNPTADDKEGWTYNTLADSPRKRIDFLFYRGLTAKYVEIFPYDANATTQASDHRPIFVDFTIP